MYPINASKHYASASLLEQALETDKGVVDSPV